MLVIGMDDGSRAAHGVRPEVVDLDDFLCARKFLEKEARHCTRLEMVGCSVESRNLGASSLNSGFEFLKSLVLIKVSDWARINVVVDVLRGGEA